MPTSLYTPTRVTLGKGAENYLGTELRREGARKVLIHYGSERIVKDGLMKTLTDQLDKEGINYVTLGGVKPNPRVSLVREGIELGRKEAIDYIVAAGGGSVIDSAKAIAYGLYDKSGGDVWDFYNGTRKPEGAYPIGVILTLSATGSEMSDSSVITNDDGGLKRGVNTDYCRPAFALLNPELTYTVSRYQTSCGTVDIMMHTLERYFCQNGDVALTDHLAEGLLKSVIDAGKIAINNPEDYEARATLMWASSLSHNGLTGCGRDYLMRCHQLEHELSGMYDRVAHGAGLAVIFPAWAKYVYRNEKALPRFSQYAVRVWGIEMDFEHPERTARAGIEATENYFHSIGMPVRLSELDIDDSGIEEMAEKCTFFGKRVLKDYIPLDKKEMIDIYRLAL